nr:fatty-acid-binding protein 2 [Ipomoea batatas]
MHSNWLLFMDFDKDPSQMFPMDPLVPYGFGMNFLHHINSVVDNSSLALQEAFSCFSKFAGALLLWFASGSNTNINARISSKQHGSHSRSNSLIQGQNISPFSKSSYRGKFAMPVVISKLSKFTIKQLFRESKYLQSIPALSLAAVLVPPFDNVSRNLLAIPLGATPMETQMSMDQSPCEVEHRGCSNSFFQSLNWSRHAVEPRTGIEFPAILDNIFAGDNNSSFTSEVLVGTGSRIMNIIKIKTLKVYAFGFYVHPFDVCQKLGPKYSSVPTYELNSQHEFYQDLLREDINMTVRLVVSCNGIKIKNVRDAFEKSLRARLVKTNPETDFHCIQTFGSIFSQDIPLHVGTTINFRRTADGHLITEIGGNHIGTVHSKELCRAFFDMYIGDLPICEKTKEQIGQNVVSIIRGC